MAANVQKVAVVQRLKAQVGELVVAFRFQCGGELGQIELAQLVVEQAIFNAGFNEPGQVFGIAGFHCGLRDFFAEDFNTNRVQ